MYIDLPFQGSRRFSIKKTPNPCNPCNFQWSLCCYCCYFFVGVIKWCFQLPMSAVVSWNRGLAISGDCEEKQDSWTTRYKYLLINPPLNNNQSIISTAVVSSWEKNETFIKKREERWKSGERWEEEKGKEKNDERGEMMDCISVEELV